MNNLIFPIEEWLKQMQETLEFCEKCQELMECDDLEKMITGYEELKKQM